MNGRVRGCVFLLTDYGLADELAGVLRAVIAREAPECSFVDLTHGVPAFDIRAGALALVRAGAAPRTRCGRGRGRPRGGGSTAAR